MKYYFTLSCLGLLLMSFVFGCKKGSTNPASNYDVYVSGVYQNAAVYWKNGTLVSLGALANASAGKIAVYGSDVYIAGAYSGQDLYYHAVYWKNGQLTDLGHGQATGIAVNGSDVYVVGVTYGDDDFLAASWKNGVLSTWGQGYINQVITSGDDVYMAGGTYDTVGSPIATYWKNNVPISLGYGQINSIAVSGSDVYAAGYSISGGTTSACYWKNGQVVKLGDETTVPTSIIVSSGDVYVAGNSPGSASGATYWKNGTAVSVPGAVTLTGIAIEGSDIFFSANYQQADLTQSPPTSSLMFENGKATTLATSNGPAGEPPTYTNGLAVVKK